VTLFEQFHIGSRGPFSVVKGRTFAGSDAVVSYTSAGVIRFYAAAAAGEIPYITDSASGFLSAGILSGDMIIVSGSSDNNVILQTISVEAGTIYVHQNYVLVNETAGAGDVTIDTLAAEALQPSDQDAINVVTNTHNREHAIDSSADHTSTITEDNLVSADANGLPDDSGIAKGDVSGAVSASHAQQHAITSTSDHTSSVPSGQILMSDANGLPTGATNTNAGVADAVSKKHSHTAQAHIIDADGTLADITAKFNTLLSDLETLGFLLSS
jgi:hypothetical protein